MPGNLREWRRRRRPGNGGRGWSRRCKPISHARDKVVGPVVRGILKICPWDAEPRLDRREEAVVEIESESTAQMIPDPSDPLIGKLRHRDAGQGLPRLKTPTVSRNAAPPPRPIPGGPCRRRRFRSRKAHATPGYARLRQTPVGGSTRRYRHVFYCCQPPYPPHHIGAPAESASRWRAPARLDPGSRRCGRIRRG